MAPYRIHQLAGLVLFLVCSVVYGLTVEPTASFWDCSEFISAAYKLQIPHPPGPPVFLLLGRLFSLFAADQSSIALAVNFLSVLSSAATIMFMYWTVVMIARKLTDNTIAQLTVAVVSSLSFAFTDTFWFSAVEAEVYALSLFFMSISFWAILKWEKIEDEAQANRWLIFIAYLIGLSIAVHPLSLLTLPSIALVYYFKRFNYSIGGLAVALIAGVGLILFTMYGLRVGIISLIAQLEMFFVNSLELPFASGAIVGAAVIIGGMVYLLSQTQARLKVHLNTLLLAVCFLSIGYSSYSLILIRSAKNPLIDMNNPQNLPNFIFYLDMLQYGTRPLVYGEHFDAKITGEEVGHTIYRKTDQRYEVADVMPAYQYAKEDLTVFPRMYSSRPDHQQAYRNITSLPVGTQPTLIDHISYFWQHQVGFQYLRYFLWNFSGRESDVQGASWLTPIAENEGLPYALSQNKGRNNYWMIPLIFGLIGAIYLAKKSPQAFLPVLALFVITGIGLVIYVNAPPTEPRERDYIYVGSFYAFALTIGFGVLLLKDGINHLIQRPIIAVSVAGVIGLSVPAVLVLENWDDHDRSGRYYSTDSAINHLASCEENAILITGGDNDTYPLWYAQDVEGYRTDVRVIVTTLFNTEWYIDQMLRKSYTSEPLPFSIDNALYRRGGLIDYIPVVDNPSVNGDAINLNQYLKLVRQKHKGLTITAGSGQEYMSIPKRKVFLNISSGALDKKSIIPDTMQHLKRYRMVFEIKGNGLQKADLMLLDMIATNNWERPIYFTHTGLANINFDLKPYVVQEGLTYRLLPIVNPDPDNIPVDTEVMYTNMMEKFQWRGLNDSSIYYSDYYQAQLINPRIAFNRLAATLIEEGDDEKASKVLQNSLYVVPDDTIPYDFSSVQTSDLLAMVGEKDQAKHITDTLVKRADHDLNYYLSAQEKYAQEIRRELTIINYCAQIMTRHGEIDHSGRYKAVIERQMEALSKAG
ncbi:MAG: DUF2723 domain-containing protein [Cyclobacteriaceae bacterium]